MSTNTKAPAGDKLAADAAKVEFERFANAWDLDLDTSEMTEEDEKSLQDAKRPILRGLCRGDIRVTDDGDLSIDLKFGKKKGETVEVKIDRADMLVMDRFKDKQNFHKLNAYVATLCGQPPKFYAMLDPRDQKRVRAPVQLFLGS